MAHHFFRQSASRPVPYGPMRHPPREVIRRHRHDEGFVALVLEGTYVESGDTGHHRVSAGDVIVHNPWESHVNAIGGRGAQVLVLPFSNRWELAARGTIADPDRVARIAARDGRAAIEEMAETFTPVATEPADWPDQLAADLRRDPGLELGTWAEAKGLHPAGLARGFRAMFGVTPADYRLQQRAHRALAAILHSPAELAHIAYEEGFADQAHMTRAVRRVSGTTPASIRRMMIGR